MRFLLYLGSISFFASLVYVAYASTRNAPFTGLTLTETFVVFVWILGSMGLMICGHDDDSDPKEVIR